MSPRSTSWYLVQSKSVVKISVGISFVASAFLRMLSSQIDSYPFVKEGIELLKVPATITVIEVTDPTANLLIAVLVSGNRNRGLSPHKFTAMPGVHKALNRTRQIAARRLASPRWASYV